MGARQTVLELFDAALRAVDGRARVRRELSSLQGGKYAVFAIGKAASAMALGALDALGDRVAQMLVITKDGHDHPELTRRERVRVLESAHPVPDERSLAAGDELLRRVRGLGDGLQPLFLISGGSSSLVESLRGDHTLAELRALNERGLAAGWNIARLNAARAQLSRIKSGGIARELGTREALALFVSDVPGDDPAVIGSGLLGPADTASDHVTRRVVANLEDATRAVRDAALARGLDVRTGAGRFDGEVADVAAAFVAQLRTCAGDGLVWGGESTVSLPARTGRGGRNTHLALSAARLLRAGEALTILAAGTDGTDGPTHDAGGLVDAGTVTRAELAGCDVERSLRDFDSGSALEMSQDLVHTGPTGTNVGDLLIGLRTSASAAHGRATQRML